MSDVKNTSNNSEQETVSEDPKRIKEPEQQLDAKTKELDGKLEAKNKEIESIKEQTGKMIGDIIQNQQQPETAEPDPLVIRNQRTFKGSFKNGYADGTVEEAKKKLISDAKRAKAGRK